LDFVSPIQFPKQNYLTRFSQEKQTKSERKLTRQRAAENWKQEEKEKGCWRKVDLLRPSLYMQLPANGIMLFPIMRRALLSFRLVRRR
jgi:hypothetical protein